VVAVAEPVGVGNEVGRVGVAVVDALRENSAVRLGSALPEARGEADAEGVAEGLAVGEGATVGGAVGRPEREKEGEAVGVGERRAEGVDEGEGLRVGAEVPLATGDCEGRGGAVGVGVGLRLAGAVGVGGGVGVAAEVRVKREVGEGGGVGAALPVAAALPVPSGVPPPLPDAVGEEREEPLLEGLPLPVPEGAGEVDAREVYVAAGESLAPALPVGVGAPLNVGAPLKVGSPERVAEWEGAASGLPPGDPLSHALADGEGGAEGVPVGEGEGDPEGAPAVGVGGSVSPGDPDALALPLPERLAAALPEAPSLGEGCKLPEGSEEGVPVKVPGALAPPLALPRPLTLGEGESRDGLDLGVPLPPPGDALWVAEARWGEGVPPPLPMPLRDAEEDAQGGGGAERGPVALPDAEGVGEAQRDGAPLPLPLGEREGAPEECGVLERDARVEGDAPLVAVRAAVGEPVATPLLLPPKDVVGGAVSRPDTVRGADSEGVAVEEADPRSAAALPDAQPVDVPPPPADTEAQREAVDLAEGDARAVSVTPGDLEGPGERDGEGEPLSLVDGEALGVSRRLGSGEDEDKELRVGGAPVADRAPEPLARAPDDEAPPLPVWVAHAEFVLDAQGEPLPDAPFDALPLPLGGGV